MRRSAMVIGLLVLATMACGRERQPHGKGTQMMLADSTPTGENITPVRLNEGVRPTEAIANFDSLPNITQADIDAGQRTPSKGVSYVRLGEPARPAEKRE